VRQKPSCCSCCNNVGVQCGFVGNYVNKRALDAGASTVYVVREEKRAEGGGGRGRGGGADRHPKVTQIAGNKHTPLQRRSPPIPRAPPAVVCARRPLALYCRARARLVAQA